MTIYKNAKRYVKKAVKKAVGAAKKRYVTKTGKGIRVNQLAKDVMYLKSIVNSEKKRIITQDLDNILGQANFNSNGYYQVDLTPIPSQGPGYNERNGASIKLHSSYFRFQFVQQDDCYQAVRGKIQIWQVKGSPSGNLNNSIAEIYEDNAFNGLIDYNSQLNPNVYNNYKLIRQKNFYIPADSIATTNLNINFGLGIKYNRGKGHHIRYANDANTVEQGQFFMIIMVDSGNCNSANTSVASIPYTAPNTGVTVSYSLTHYYYDN